MNTNAFKFSIDSNLIIIMNHTIELWERKKNLIQKIIYYYGQRTKVGSLFIFQMKHSQKGKKTNLFQLSDSGHELRFIILSETTRN